MRYVKDNVVLYQGLDTDQQTRDGRNPDTYSWYWAPISYYGDTLWSTGYKSKEEAEHAAEQYYAGKN